MNMEFQKQEVSCLKPVVCQVQNLEQTQEVRLPEGASGTVRILGAWGQTVVRSKQWQSDRFLVTGGIQARVLWETEEAGGVQTLEAWIPLKLEWDLEPAWPEGRASVQLLLRSLDARVVSAGKVMIRASMGGQIRCWCAETLPICQAREVPEDVSLLRQDWPVRLPREAGEKHFELEEALTLPPSAPAVERLLYARMDPEVTDQKVMGDKLVFRGNGNLHILYQCEEGMLHGWDFTLPFSQYAQLEGSYSADAQGEVVMALTALELEPDGTGKLVLRSGLTGQYLVDDRQLVQTVADAYSLRRELEVQREQLLLPGILDRRRENLYGELTIPVSGDVVADASVLPDFPRQRREPDAMVLEVPGTIQVLYYDAGGKLQSGFYRWQAAAALKAGPDVQLHTTMLPVQSQLQTGMDSMTLRADLPVQVTAVAGGGLPMVTALELGEQREADPGRPSLILRRAEGETLWDLARQSGSTVDAIRDANGLEGEPEPKRMLLIPVM